jgi:hypothetical protein
MVVPDCPECAQGKHQNCTQMVLVDKGTMIDHFEPCPCKERDHAG